MIICTVSLVASFITLYLIYDFNKWNGYILLIFTLTIFQGIYDLSFYFILGFQVEPFFMVYKFLSVFSGTFIAIWVNYISLLLYYTVLYLESVNIRNQFTVAFPFVLTISFLLSSAVMAIYLVDETNSIVDNIYYWTRMFSIFMNIIIYYSINLTLEAGTSSRFSSCCKQRPLLLPDRISPNTTHKSDQHSTNSDSYYANLRSKTNDLLLVLASRLKYYPIVQTVSRAGAAWWEYKYGFKQESFVNQSFTTTKEVSFYLFCISSPIAGVGFLIVFLIVQPIFYKRFKHICTSALDVIGFGGLSRIFGLRNSDEVNSDFGGESSRNIFSQSSRQDFGRDQIPNNLDSNLPVLHSASSCTRNQNHSKTGQFSGSIPDHQLPIVSPLIQGATVQTQRQIERGTTPQSLMSDLESVSDLSSNSLRSVLASGMNFADRKAYVKRLSEMNDDLLWEEVERRKYSIQLSVDIPQ